MGNLFETAIFGMKIGFLKAGNRYLKTGNGYMKAVNICNVINFVIKDLNQ